MEDALEATQPEEQHGFRQGRRIEEHLLTANICLQKTLAANVPLWIISLDLSKAFDKIDWNALWTSLGQHGISEHLIWILQCIYYGQTGVVREHNVDSYGFNIRGGVRQGCVLSPRLFSSVLEMALSSWRAKMEAQGLSLGDGFKPLLDLRFADDILLFCTTLDKACLLLDELVASLAQVGLTLNLKKTKILTTQAQPPQQLET
ncbi:MAG: reverse transcriptase family protein, partial [Cohaesibacter sp.]|nr:reverse transcriptase family protein [Cohaesibacter sp.]